MELSERSSETSAGSREKLPKAGPEMAEFERFSEATRPAASQRTPAQLQGEVAVSGHAS